MILGLTLPSPWHTCQTTARLGPEISSGNVVGSSMHDVCNRYSENVCASAKDRMLGTTTQLDVIAEFGLVAS